MVALYTEAKQARSICSPNAAAGVRIMADEAVGVSRTITDENMWHAERSITPVPAAR